MMRAAQEKAQAIVDEAASKHEELVDESEVVARARTTADVVLREAEERADGVEAAHLHGEPVQASVKGAQIAGVIEDRACKPLEQPRLRSASRRD